MGSPIVVILVFFGVIAVTAVIFCMWVFVAIIKGIFRALGWSARAVFPQQRNVMLPLPNVTCARPKCGASNPTRARFCRRCGQPLATPQSASVRRVAMW